MQSDSWGKAFTWLKRVNSLLFLVLGAVVLIAIFLSVLNVWLFASRNAAENQIKEVAGTKIADTELNFGQFRRVLGTRYFYAQLGTANSYYGSGSGSGVANVRNILFLDSTSKRSHWLLTGNSQRIYRTKFVYDDPDFVENQYGNDACRAGVETLAILFELGPVDESPNEPGPHRILATAANGEEETELVTAAEAVLGVAQVTVEQTLIFYTQAGLVKLVEFNPVTRQVVVDQVLE